jgi:hypothetical protein
MEPNIHDKRAANPDKVLSPDFIPLFGGRPLRAARIGKDDALDLKILLNTTEDVGQFVAKC